MFPGIAHHWFKDGLIHSAIPEFHPYSSLIMNLLVTDKDDTSGGVSDPQGVGVGTIPPG